MSSNNKRKLRDLDDVVNEMLQSEEGRADSFLELALEEYEKDGDEGALLIALRQVARAKGGVAKLAKKTGLSRESLYKTLSPFGNPKLKTLRIILNALGYTFKFQHV